MVVKYSDFFRYFVSHTELDYHNQILQFTTVGVFIGSEVLSQYHSQIQNPKLASTQYFRPF